MSLTWVFFRHYSLLYILFHDEFIFYEVRHHREKPDRGDKGHFSFFLFDSYFIRIALDITTDFDWLILSNQVLHIPLPQI